MRSPVVPNHFRGMLFADGGDFTNVRLRFGEVQKVIPPDDPANISGRWNEYSVWVQHRANGTAVTKMYDNCLAIDHYGSKADFDHAGYRADDSATREDGQRQLGPGLGARVLLLCINGESQSAVILGGLRVDDPDTTETGHYRHARFNGIDLLINNDGEMTLTYQGAQDLKGEKREDVDENALGTFVKISKDGNLLVSDKEGGNSILLDHASGKIDVVSENEVNVTAPTVRLGDNETSDPAVGGNELKQVLSDLCDAIGQLTVITGEGTSSTPVNTATFQAIKGRLDQILSGTVSVKL